MKIKSAQAYLELGFRLGGAAMVAVCLSSCSGGSEVSKGDWAVASDSTQAIDHSAWDGLLAKYVKAYPDGVNRVDYAALKKNDAATLTAYLAAMQAVDIQSFNKNEQFAFWVNLYNAATVDVIVREYPIKSIKDIGLLGQGPWKDKILTVNGRKLSLDDIEHKILRPTWNDVRIHYAVNCASIGCPNLAARAYTAAQLEPMLDEAAKAYVNHPRGFARIDGDLTASSIFDWYVDDWGDQTGVLDHARQYATAETKAMLGDATQIDGHDYNWSLNDAK
jgi:Protein of unknown function, DUF547